jgi:hypothetical protein
MQKIFARSGDAEVSAMGGGTNSRNISQKMAIICGVLALLTTLILVTVAALSSNYIIEQQEQERGAEMTAGIANEIAPVLASGDLIRLEVSLRGLLKKYGLLGISVFDIEARELSSAGEHTGTDYREYVRAIDLDGDIAGEIRVRLLPSAARMELQRMSLGLVSLAFLSSLFAAGLGARWGLQLAERLRALNTQLQLDTSLEEEFSGDEISQLEKTVDSLPLDLLRRPADAAGTTANYQEAGLLYLHLDSLSRHVETLDESSLLHYTELQRLIIDSAAQLYGGKLAVVRQFGILVTFSDQGSGSPGFRALSTAWLIAQLAAATTANGVPRIRLSQACGISETGTGTSKDIYPDLYNQHLIDELVELATGASGRIALTTDCAGESEVANRCRTEQIEEQSVLTGFEEPYSDLLERQRTLLMRDLQQHEKRVD